jgi:hypothetical protein
VHTPLISFDFQSDSGFWICLQPIGHWSGYKWRNEFEKILIYTCLVSELSLGEDNPMFYYMLGIKLYVSAVERVTIYSKETEE